MPSPLGSSRGARLARRIGIAAVLIAALWLAAHLR